MAVPGAEQHDQIRESLPALSRQARTAFAVACADRVLPVLEDYYGPPCSECRKALDLAWRFALGEDPLVRAECDLLRIANDTASGEQSRGAGNDECFGCGPHRRHRPR